MPRYRVILEFDHPGDGAPILETGDTTKAPNAWKWERIVSDDVRNLRAEVYVQDGWVRVTDE